MTSANGLTIVVGDFNATVGEAVQGVVGSQRLGSRTSDNEERLVFFATSNGMCTIEKDIHLCIEFIQYHV